MINILEERARLRLATDMSKVVIIGAGGVGNVVAQKCAQLADVFTEIVLASRTVTKCERSLQMLSPSKTSQFAPRR